eukprot:g18400.t1
MQAAGHPGVQQQALRVGKLVAAMRGKAPPRAEKLNWGSLPERATPEVLKVAIEQQLIPRTRAQWNSLPAKVQAMPEVVKVAIEQQLIWAPEQWNSLPAEVQAMPDVVAAAIKGRLITTPKQWNSLPAEVRADKDVVLAAIRIPFSFLTRRQLITTPEQWNALPAEVRADKDVVLAVIRADPFSFLTREQWWNSLPAKVQAMPDVVEAAIQMLLISTPEQWNSLPAEVRAEKQVILAAIDQSRQRRVFEPAACFFDSRGNGYSFVSELCTSSQDLKQELSDLFFAGIGRGESEEIVLAAVRKLS